MKRLLFFALSLFAMMGSAWADHWTVNYTPTADDTQTETYVYALLQLPSAGSDSWQNYVAGSDAGSIYEIAAYIDDDVRAVATEPAYVNPAVQTNEEISLWRFQVVGGQSELNSKTITFKVYNSSTRLEYNVTATAPFDGERTGDASDPLLIQLSEPTSMTLADFTINVDETKNLLDVVTFLPEGSVNPNDVKLEAVRIPDTNPYKVENNVFTALEPAPDGVTLALQAGTFFANCKVTILAPAQSLELNGDNEVTVWADESDELNNFLNNCYTILPENTTDVVTWTSNNTDVVEIVEGGTYANPKAKGDAVLTGTANGLTITVTVHVKQHVELIEPMDGINSDNPVECSVGDVLTPYFVDGQVFNVLPANADNKEVTITTDYTDFVKIENGAITAIADGDAYITVTSVDNPEASYTFWVKIHNEVKDLTFDSQSLTVDLEDGEKDITSLITSNMHFTPLTGEFNGYWLSIESSADEVVSVGYNDGYRLYSPEDVPDYFIFTAKKAGTATITVKFGTDDYLEDTFGTYKGSEIVTKTFDVVVNQKVTGITTPFSFTAPGYLLLDCSVGDDLTEYFVDGKAFNILPADASNKGVNFSLSDDWNADNIEILNDGSIKAKENANEGTTAIRVESMENSAIYALVYVYVHNDVQEISANDETVAVQFPDDGENDISDALNNNLSWGPEGAQTFYNGINVTVEPRDILTFTDKTAEYGQLHISAKANYTGTATVTLTYHVKDYLAASFDASGNEHVTDKTVTFTVDIKQGLTGLEFTFDDSDYYENQPGVLYVIPQPLGTEIDVMNLTVTATSSAQPDWNAMTVGDIEYVEGSEGRYKVNIVPLIPGEISFTAHYDDGSDDGVEATCDPRSVGVRYDYNEGWEWRNIFFGNVNDYDINSLFGYANKGNIEEIRTETQEVLNDPTYGYFGDLDLMAQNRCFKIKSKKAFDSYLFTCGTLWVTEDINLHYGWNWIPNPFFFNRLLTNVFNAEVFEPTEGDRIMSKSDGFADYNGSEWVGTLTSLSRAQGYLYFSADQEEKLLEFADESQMDDSNDEGTESVAPARLKTAAHSKFTFNPSRFRDNMGIVAEIEDVQCPENYSVVAFVGDECRGEGVCVDGKMFITVHANAGEQVSFRLIDNVTGEMFDIDQTVRFGAMLGSLKAPFRMSSQAVVTGVNNVQCTMNNVQTFDLGGRSVKANTNGMTIQRRADGSVRKVVK